MLKPFSIAILVGFLLLSVFNLSGASDYPHATPEGVECTSCHLSHNSLGGNLTNQTTNPILCKSCHTLTGTASNWPFKDSDQANPGVSGISHKWTGAMPASSNPTNARGLRASADLKSSEMRTRLSGFNNVVTCSICHDQHSHQNTPWDPSSFNASTGDYGIATGGSTTAIVQDTKNWTTNQWTNYYVIMNGGTDTNLFQRRLISSNTNNTLTISTPFSSSVVLNDAYYITQNIPTNSANESGTATSGSTTTITQTGKTWATDQWAGYSVKMTGGLNNGLERRVQSNTTTQLTLATPFPNAVAANDTYYLKSNRHFMRTNNALNEACIDCHSYRNQEDVTLYTGNPLSHPVGKSLSAVKDPTQFFTVPREPGSAGFTAQTGTRGELNGSPDTNVTNNIVLGLNNEINCLSCHGVHYTDSNSSTIHKP